MHSFLPSFFRSLVHWFVGSLNDSSFHWFAHCFIGWFTRSLTHALIGLFNRSELIHSCLHPLMHSFRQSVVTFIHSLSHALVLSCHFDGISTIFCSFLDAPHNFDALLFSHPFLLAIDFLQPFSLETCTRARLGIIWPNTLNIVRPLPLYALIYSHTTSGFRIFFIFFVSGRFPPHHIPDSEVCIQYIWRYLKSADSEVCIQYTWSCPPSLSLAVPAVPAAKSSPSSSLLSSWPLVAASRPLGAGFGFQCAFKGNG